MARALISVPARARRGDVVEIKTLVSHPMETGYRRSQVGSVSTRAPICEAMRPITT